MKQETRRLEIKMLVVASAAASAAAAAAAVVVAFLRWPCHSVFAQKFLGGAVFRSLVQRSSVSISIRK